MSLRIAAQAEPLPGYVLVERLGAGGFGEVWKAVAPGGIAKAIKIIHGDLRSGVDACFALQELKALARVKQVRHPYLLALDRFDVVEGRLLIVMELADCNLWDRFVQCREAGLPGIPRHELLTYMLETAEVLDLFNDQFQLQHLDIKPQNLFLLHNHIKVADFGQVKDLQGLVAAVTGGITPVYAAPETFDGVITRYCDQYSLACVYQELLTGRRPFDGTTPAQLLRQHLFQAPHLEPLPPSDRPIVARALAKKPEERWPTVTA
ncbi:MAG: serine/threonine-protein kinase, partial [Thermogemmata sp.]